MPTHLKILTDSIL